MTAQLAIVFVLAPGIYLAMFSDKLVWRGIGICAVFFGAILFLGAINAL